MNKKNIIFIVSSIAAASATYILGHTIGSIKEKNKHLKVSGKLKVAYDGEDDEQPSLGLVINNINDLKSKYIVLEVKTTIIDNTEHDA